MNNPISIGVAPASYYSDMKRKNESINLLSGKPVQVWVDYEGTMLSVLSGHYILWWSFSTRRGSLQRLDIERLVEVPHSSAPHKKLPIILLVCLTFVVFSLLA